MGELSFLTGREVVSEWHCLVMGANPYPPHIWRVGEALATRSAALLGKQGMKG